MCESRIEELKGKARANCERKSTIQIVKKNPQFKGAGRLTNQQIRGLTTGARAAIRMHAPTKNTTQLWHDLCKRNGWWVRWLDYDRAFWQLAAADSSI